MPKDKCELCDEIPTVEIICRLSSSWTCSRHEKTMTDICVETGVHIVEIADRPLSGLEYRR